MGTRVAEEAAPASRPRNAPSPVARVVRAVGAAFWLCVAAVCGAPEESDSTRSSSPADAARAVAEARRLTAADDQLRSLLTPTADGFLSDGSGFTSPGWRAADEKVFDGVGVRLPAQADEPFTFGVSRIARFALSVELDGAQGVEPHAHEGAVVYPDAYASTDVVFATSSHRVEELLLLRDGDAPRTFSWSIELPSGLPSVRSESAGGIAFQDSRGQTVLHVPPAVAFDAAGTRRQASQIWSETGRSTGRMEVSLDTAGLVFPVLLDPAIETVMWREIPGYIGKRAAPAMVFDTARGRAVVFGGVPPVDAVSNDTFEYDGVRWERIEPAHRPLSRTYHALAYDSQRQRTVLFGGWAGANPLDDTWEWDGSDWIQRFPVTRPLPRQNHVMAYDSARGVTVMFGGSNFADTWEWDGNDWTQRTPATTSPPVTWGERAMAYDSARQRTVFVGLFGTYEWNGNDWEDMISADHPNVADIAALAYDSDRGTMVLPATGWEGTWEWDGVDWTKLSDPDTDPYPLPLRYYHAAAYDTVARRTLMYGGAQYYGDEPLNDTWAWNGVGWAELAPDDHDWVWNGVDWVQNIPVRPGDLWNGHTMVFDAARGETLLYGAQPNIDAEMWALKDDQWLDRTLPWPSEVPWTYEGATMAFDDQTGNVLHFGRDSGGKNGLWEWNGTTWTNVPATVRPTERTHAGFVMDTVRHRAVLFGGCVPDCSANPVVVSGDTWEWDGSSWTDVTPAVSPPARRFHGLVFDTKRGRTLLFGGENATGKLGDTWEWDGALWTPRTPPSNPGARSGMSLAFNTARGRAVLFGGESPQGYQNYLDDTWEWDGATWLLQSHSLAPEPRTRHVMTYDPIQRRVVLFGGRNGTQWDTLGDAWEYRSRGGACAVGSDCDTGSCVENVCCEVAGCGTCEACDTPADPGRCAPVTNAQDDSCNGANACNAAGVCLLALGQPSASGAACGSGYLSDGVCCSTAACGPCQACNTLASPGVCAALTNVIDADSCSGAQRCDASGVCKLADGQPCAQSSACASSSCADGVCCDKTCAGPCVACTTAKKGAGVDGVCGFVLEGTDPQGACVDGGAASCGDDGMCDAHGTCRKYASGTACLSSACTPGVNGGHALTGPEECDGFGTCVDGGNLRDCGLYGCNPTFTDCLTLCALDTDCISTARCVGDACLPRRPLADPCSTGDDCLSGHCADGYCCDQACDGQCEACDDPRGYCTLVDGDPRPPRPACEGTDATCRGQCQGDPSACIYPSAQTSCGGDACQGMNVMASLCDGLGDCKQAMIHTCVEFACADGACNDTCASDTDCAPFYVCEASDCLAIAVTCDGDHTLLSPDGSKQDCSPYRCTPEDDVCLDACGSKIDCADGNECTASGACSPPTEEAPVVDAGCSVSAAPAPRPSPLWPSLALLALARRGWRRRAAAAIVCLFALVLSACDAESEPLATRDTIAMALRVAERDPVVVAALAPRDDAWAAHSAGFASTGGGAAAPLRARLPPNASGEVSIGAGRLERFRMRAVLEGVADVPGFIGRGSVVYQNAYPSTDLVFTSSATRIEAWMLLLDDDAPSTFAWRVDLPDGIVGVRRDGVHDRALALVDERGATVLAVKEPFAIDANGTRRDARLDWESPATEPSGAGRLVVRLDPSGLAFPVLLDPAFEAAVWQKQPLVEPRTSAAMAFDSARGRVVLFGGGYHPTGTWEWDGSSWHRATPLQSPSPRYSPEMAYDEARGTIVLFGGQTSVSPSSQTWTWDGTDWSQRAPAHSPPPGGFAAEGAMAYDSVRERIVLFIAGGTWEWDGVDWTQKTGGPAPPNTSYLFMTFDAVRAKTVLRAGSQTWEWDGTAWTNRTPATPTPQNNPGAFGPLAFDPIAGRVVFFGGNETWEWDGTDWTLDDPAASVDPRSGHLLAFDGQRTLLFGGSDGNILGDTWGWDGATWSLLAPQQAPPANQPSPLAFDGLRGRAVLHQGDTTTTGQTWEWDGTSWSLRAKGPGPGTHFHPSIAFDEERAETVLVSNAKTWTWNGSQWVDETPSGSPSARSDAALAYDPTRKRIVLFGGRAGPFDTSLKLADTWEWDGTSWENRASTGPGARHSAAMAFDPVSQKVLLHGGFAGTTVGFVQDDTWQWDGSSWALQTPAARPTPRYAHGLASDPIRNTVVLTGGLEPSGAPPSVWDTWEWDGTNWTPMTTTTGPSGREYAGLTNLNGRTLLFGGEGLTDPSDTSAEYLGDTWTYYLHGGACLTGSECDTGSCVDGVCCDAPCGPCEACDTAASPGTCAAIVNTTDPDSCMGITSCSAAGDCLFVAGEPCASGGECASGSCVDGVCCGASACDTCQACNLTGNPGTCAGISNVQDPGTCDGTSVCDPLGQCRLQMGQPCGAASACASDRCVDGVCCDADCTGACVACSAAAKGQGADGECGVVLAGTDSNGDCDAAAPTTCGFEGACDGQGACRVYAAHVKCGDTTCADGANGAHSKWSGLACDGQGACVLEPAEQDCGLIRCDTSTGFCLPSCADSTDCILTARCVDGACEARSGLGSACSEDDACQSGHCTDGVCCSAGCTGQCQACNEPGKVGFCSPVPMGEAPREPRLSCNDEDPSCGGTCDGVHVEDCAYPDVDVACGEPTCADELARRAHCNGNGACGAETESPCAPFACGAATCKTSCADDSDCGEAFRCDAATHGCVGASGVCDGDHVLIDKDGATVDCAPYRCTGANVCLTECGSKLDCAGGASCNSKGKCEGEAPPPVDGCTAASRPLPPRSDSPGFAWATLAGVFSVLARRRHGSQNKARSLP